MIQSPLKRCRDERGMSLMLIIALSLVLLIPGGLLALSSTVENVATNYLELHRPRVFMEASAEPSEVKALISEIEGWPDVERVQRLDPQQNLEFLTLELGEDVVSELGITRSMLPQGLEIVPSIPLVGHVDLVAKVAGLEARQAVAVAQVPPPTIVRFMTLAAGLLGTALVLFIISVLGSWLLLGHYLRGLRREEQDQDNVLELFGATRQQLGGPTLIRGIAAGGAAGLVSAVALAVLVSILQGTIAAILGSVPAAAAAWFYVLALPFAGMLLGLAAGLPLARRSSLSDVSLPDGLVPYFGA